MRVYQFYHFKEPAFSFTVIFYFLFLVAISFPGLKDVALCRRCLVEPSRAICFWPPESGAPGVSPVWAACALLL